MTFYGVISNFPFILVCPDKPSNIIKIFVESNNSDYSPDKKDFESQKKEAIEYAQSLCIPQTNDRYSPAYLFQNINQPVIIPIIRRCDDEHAEEFYTQMLGKNVVCQTQGEFANLSTQVVNMVKYIQESYRSKGYDVMEKSAVYGFSASGVFAARLQFAEPESFDLCLSICSNAVQPLPMASINGIDLPYPLGTSDYKLIMNKEFNEEEYRKAQILFIVGEEEPNDKYNIAYGDTLHDKHTQELYTKVFGHVGVHARQNMIKEFLKQGEFENVRCLVEPGGHSLYGKLDIIIDFLQNYQSTILKERGKETNPCS